MDPEQQAARDNLGLNESTSSNDNVDRTLIKWMLSMTPAERLEVLQQAVNSLNRLKNGRFQT
jgi:hypothetical protein